MVSSRKRRKWKAIKSVIPLTGGFGNQLFQYAFGLYLERVEEQEVTFDQNIGNPRLIGQQISLLSITSEAAPAINSRCRQVMDSLASKAYGWNLVRGLSAEKSPGVRGLLLKTITWMILAFRLRTPVKLMVSKDLGFDSTLDTDSHSIYIGYFQTYKYCLDPSVHQILKSIRPKIMSQKYLNLKDEIKNSNPVLVHLRLKDYLSEREFGIPSSRYFEKCLEKIAIENELKSIWVISDDTTAAMEYFDQTFKNLPVQFFNQSGLSDVEVWDLMRHFSAYIISNSTFAWWAAFLRENQGAPVYAPDPWFQGMASPNKLIPEDWTRVKAK